MVPPSRGIVLMSACRTWIVGARLIVGGLIVGCAGEGDGGGGGGSPSPDAPPAIDAPPSTVTEVTPCPATPDAIVTTRDDVYVYMPATTTIAAGQVVRFDTSLYHDVAPLPPMTDAALSVGFGATRCLRFTAPGTFRFKCTPHGFSGTITVN